MTAFVFALQRLWPCIYALAYAYVIDYALSIIYTINISCPMYLSWLIKIKRGKKHTVSAADEAERDLVVNHLGNQKLQIACHLLNNLII